MLQIAVIYKIVFNYIMTKHINDKVVSLFKKRDENIKKNEPIKFFAGYEYVRFDKDLNGNPFIEKNLIEYSKSCRYIVRVMKERNKNISLYNYDVPSEKLYQFLTKFETNELSGQIIEIDKYIPETLA